MVSMSWYQNSSNTYILDGTRKYQSYKTPPDNILNRKVFNADTASTDWLYVSDSRPLLKSVLMVNAILADDGKLVGNATLKFYDHSKGAAIDGE